MIRLRQIGIPFVAALLVAAAITWRAIPDPDFTAVGNRTACFQEARAVMGAPSDRNATTDLAFSYTASDGRVVTGTMDKDSSHAFQVEQYRDFLNGCLYESGRSAFYATHAPWTTPAIKARIAERL